jgi:hypothetical protein
LVTGRRRPVHGACPDQRCVQHAAQ